MDQELCDESPTRDTRKDCKMMTERVTASPLKPRSVSPWQFALLLPLWMMFSGPTTLLATDLAPGQAVILSEIQYNPPPELGPDGEYEYLEVHNRGVDLADLSGWRLMDRGDSGAFQFPAGTSIAPGDYLVIAGNAAALRALYGEGVAIVGDLGFRLSNGGDTIRLIDGEGQLADRVEYDDRFPWPLGADGAGSSLERVSLAGDITDFTNFHPSISGGTPGAPNSRAGDIPGRHDVVFSEIMYHPVVDPEAESRQHCEAHEFFELHNRASKPVAVSGWRISAGVDFVFPDGAVIEAESFLVVYSDEIGFQETYGTVLNAMGPFARRLDNGGEAVSLVDHTGAPVDYVQYDDNPSWPVNADGIRGSLELIDAFGDNNRAQAWRTSKDFRGTPGKENSATSRFGATGSPAAPPQITEVRARPLLDADREQLLSTDEVAVTARVRDRDGVAGVRLEYQVVRPGDYIGKTDPRFETEWTTVEMAYDAERLVYSALLEPQPHRTLVRYRISAVDVTMAAAEAWAPFPEDPEPNFAYFVYDGVPNYVANRKTGFGELGFTHTNLERVPVYHLIMKQPDFDELWYVERDATDNTYSWQVTVVHENRVYDHCGVRLRGSPNSRYGPAKRSMKVRINKGNRFRGRFHDGTPYPSRRSRLSLHAGGFLDAMAHQLHHDSGGLSPRAALVQLRVINTEDEHDQYTGDFLGLYADIQSIDKSLLRDNNRSLAEASSLYKMKGYPNKKHSDCDTSVDDIEQFFRDAGRTNEREWFESNLDLESYFSFRAAIQLTNNHDMDSRKNIGYYFNSEVGLWELIPWDVECAFHIDPCTGEEPLSRKVPRLFELQYKNRYRFVWQVHFDTERILGMIDSWSDLIRELADADVDRWTNEPRLSCPTCPDGTFSAAPSETRHQWMKDFVHQHRPFALRELTDFDVPLSPINVFPRASMTPPPPVRLATLPFVDGSGTHAATHWLLIEPGGDWAYPHWELESATDLVQVTVPADVTETGKQYLFRAAHIDSTGRRSFLSEPTTFQVGPGSVRPPDAPTGLTVEHAGARSITLTWNAADVGASIVGYRILRGETSLEGRLISEVRYTDFGPPTGDTVSYRVVALNNAGLESAPSMPVTVGVPARGLGGWKLPVGGWDYLYDARPGEDLYTDAGFEGQPAYLDGTWRRRSVYNNWDGSAPGDPDGAPGGVAVETIAVGEDPVSVLTLEDAGDPSVPAPNNRRLVFRHGTGSSFLEDGITLIARLRVHPEPSDLPAPKGQTPDRDRGHIGVGHRAEERGHFSLWLNDGQLVTKGGHSVDIETKEFQTVWVVIEKANATGHRVRLFLNGDATPVLDTVLSLSSRGTEGGFEQSYLEMGLSNLDDSGAIQVDYTGYKRGVHLPEGNAEAATFVRGDVDADGNVNIADAITLLDYLFRGSDAISCPDTGDADDSGRLNLSDVLRIVNHVLFRGTPVAEPFPDCGPDESADTFARCSGSPCA